MNSIQEKSEGRKGPEVEEGKSNGGNQHITQKQKRRHKKRIIIPPKSLSNAELNKKYKKIKEKKRRWRNTETWGDKLKR